MNSLSFDLVIDGLRSVSDKYGTNGPPVVLLHGIPGYRRNFERIASLISAQAVVYVPDLPGYGESEGPVEAWHIEQQASWLIKYIEHLGVRNVHVVGFDFGGPIAVTAYSSAPDLFASLILANTNVFADSPIPLPLRIGLVPGLGDVAFRLLFGRAGLSMLWFPAVANKKAFSFGMFRRMLSSDRGVQSTRQVMLNSFRHLKALYTPIEQALGTIAVPTIVLWGQSDPFFSPAIGRRVASSIPHAELRPLPGVGHFVPEEDPNAVAAAVVDLINEDHRLFEGTGTRNR